MLIANTAFGQVLRLPRLIHHYLEHCKWDNNSSVVDFLTKHYSGEIAHPDDEHKDHENLPFKSADKQIASAQAFIIQQVIALPRPAFFPLSLKQANHLNNDYSNAYLSCIWQPPRLS